MKSIHSSDDITRGQIRQRRRSKSNVLVLGQLTGSAGPAPGVLADRRIVKDRRRERSARAFFYGNFRPRRRASRRAVERDRFVFDWHEPHLLYVAVAIVLLSCADALFTLNLLNIGAVEINQVMNSLLSIGVEQFLWIKIGTTAVSVLALVFAAQARFMGRFRVIRVLQVICFGYAVLIGYEIFLFSRILDMDPISLAILMLDL